MEVLLFRPTPAEEIEDVEHGSEDQPELLEPYAIFEEDQVDLQGAHDPVQVMSGTVWEDAMIRQTHRPRVVLAGVTGHVCHKPEVRRDPETMTMLEAATGCEAE
jgi:hypothetical protein